MGPNFQPIQSEMKSDVEDDLNALDVLVDAVQQASLVADQAVLEIRNTRTNEGIRCR